MRIYTWCVKIRTRSPAMRWRMVQIGCGRVIELAAEHIRPAFRWSFAVVDAQNLPPRTC